MIRDHLVTCQGVHSVVGADPLVLDLLVDLELELFGVAGAGFPLTVWNRSPERAAFAEAMGIAAT